MLVTPLEDQEILKSSDIISFSIKNENSKDYIIGQKIKVTNIGDVKETYTARVNDISEDIVNN